MFPVTDFSDLPIELRWRCETVEPGTELTGLIAGKIIPVRTHWNGEQTLPCLHWMTKGALFCPCTAKPMHGTKTAYTPIITSANERVVVPASALVGFELSKYAAGKLITLRRTKLRCAPLKISVPGSVDQDQAWVKKLKTRCVADIENYLLHLWQLPELNKFFGVPFRPSIKSMVYSGQSDDPTATASA